jgi:hypothetical protein
MTEECEHYLSWKSEGFRRVETTGRITRILQKCCVRESNRFTQLRSAAAGSGSIQEGISFEWMCDHCLLRIDSAP